jgi:hypothetical protein
MVEGDILTTVASYYVSSSVCTRSVDRPIVNNHSSSRASTNDNNNDGATFQRPSSVELPSEPGISLDSSSSCDVNVNTSTANAGMGHAVIYLPSELIVRVNCPLFVRDCFVVVMSIVFIYVFCRKIGYTFYILLCR